MQQIKELSPDHSATILDIINDAANAYKGAIPDDRWKEPYMSTKELADEIRAGPIHRYNHSYNYSAGRVSRWGRASARKKRPYIDPLPDLKQAPCCSSER